MNELFAEAARVDRHLVATPRAELELVKRRLKIAEEIHAERSAGQEEKETKTDDTND